jgi:hypothetical protein
VGCYWLKEHQLRFHKLSKDGSGKCDAYFTGSENDYVIGALFDIDPCEKMALDIAEGLGFGYSEKSVILTSQAEQQIEAFTYYALIIDASLKPYSWYLNHVLVGANESQLPADYIEIIGTVASMQDADLIRHAKELGIHR